MKVSHISIDRDFLKIIFFVFITIEVTWNHHETQIFCNTY